MEKNSSHKGSDALADTVKDIPVCSKLNLDGVHWPQSLNLLETKVLLLALNITGANEGPDQWSNISDNFDGQGLSLGILNQNLGQGSLQPLLIDTLHAISKSAAGIFQKSHLVSLSQMLNEWNSQRALFSLESEVQLMSAPMGKNLQSVEWAIKTIYQNGKFIPLWKEELQQIAQQPKYVSLQIARAAELSRQATRYMEQLQLHELRSYLTLFDVVVQSGSISDWQFHTYQNWLSSHSASNEITRLKQIVGLRAASIENIKHQVDFVNRKNAIMDGKGIVHDAYRNFESDYCYEGTTPILN